MVRRFFINALAAALIVASVLSIGRSPARADHDFTINNRGYGIILKVYIKGSRYADWGSDLLADDEVIIPGYQSSFTLRQGCIEDIELVYLLTSKVYRNFDTCSYDFNAF
jgi:hypothetical protein